MFEIKLNYSSNCFFICNRGQSEYLHCDGRIADVREYFESIEIAEKVLEKYYPKPKHTWKHGDVFMNGRLPMIYIKYDNKKPAQAICLECPVGGPALGSMVYRLNNAKFLFNIKEKINEKNN